jgi:dephospho-CoA kinase
VDLQIQRAMERNGNYHKDIKNRIETQMPIVEKLKYTDYTLNNDGTREELKFQVFNMYKKLQGLA